MATPNPTEATMDEPNETKYEAWLTDFCSDEPNVTAETDVAPLSTFKHGIMVRAGKVQPASLVCGTISSVFSVHPALGVGLTLKAELEKARGRIAELEANLDTAHARIASLESKPVVLEGDPDWVAPSTHFPKWFR